MRIYQMLHFPLGGAGAGVYAHDLATFLTAAGHEVRVLRAAYDPAEPDLPGVRVHFTRRDMAHRQGGADMDFDFPVFHAHPYSDGGTFGDLTSTQLARYQQVFRAKMRAALDELRPDIVHVHHGWVLGALMRELNVPYVVTLHGSEAHGFKAFPAYRALALAGLAGAARVMAVDEAVATEARTLYGLPAAQLQVIRSGVDVDVFQPRPIDRAALLARLGLPDASPSQPVVLFAGRLIPLKGADVLLAAAQAYARGPDAPLTVLAGEGSERPRLEQLAAQLAPHRVAFTGHVPHAEMATYFNLADVVVVPSRLDTFPLVALEALACGTPLVTSDVGGLPRIVGALGGRSVPADNAVALGDAVTQLLRENFKACHQPALRAYAVEHFAFARMVRDVAAVYQAVQARMTPHAAGLDTGHSRAGV